jgi:hypothetical protein
MPARWAGVPAVRSNSVIHGTAENHFVDASSVEIDDLECERVSFDPVTPSLGASATDEQSIHRQLRHRAALSLRQTISQSSFENTPAVLPAITPLASCGVAQNEYDTG